jgi:hypothetical protein
VVAGTAALSGCGVGGADGDADAEAPPVSASVVETGTPAVPAAETTVVEVDADVDADVEVDLEPDAGLVAACVEFVQFHAYVGDPEGVAIWTRVGETAEGLDAWCRTTVVDDEDAVEDMRDALAAARAAETVAAAASTTLAPGCHRSYGDCLPIVSDIDCVRDRDGDGPVYQGLSVLVFGPDEYDLDRDDDGLACEPGDQ